MNFEQWFNEKIGTFPEHEQIVRIEDQWHTCPDALTPALAERYMQLMGNARKYGIGRTIRLVQASPSRIELDLRSQP